MRELCSFGECNNLAKAKGLCSSHYCKLWRQSNSEYTKVWNSMYRSTHKDYFSEYSKDYRQTHKEQFRAYDRKYYAANPEKHKQEVYEWIRKNPDKYRAIQRNRKARLAGAEGTHSDKDVILLMLMQQGKCVICSCWLDTFHVDHIIPISKGGRNDIPNLQLLCPSCNCSKGSKLDVNGVSNVGK